MRGPQNKIRRKCIANLKFLEFLFDPKVYFIYFLVLEFK